MNVAMLEQKQKLGFLLAASAKTKWPDAIFQTVRGRSFRSFPLAQRLNMLNQAIWHSPHGQTLFHGSNKAAVSRGWSGSHIR